MWNAFGDDFSPRHAQGISASGNQAASGQPRYSIVKEQPPPE
jgi:hypothetical protein